MQKRFRHNWFGFFCFQLLTFWRGFCLQKLDQLADQSPQKAKSWKQKKQNQLCQNVFAFFFSFSTCFLSCFILIVVVFFFLNFQKNTFFGVSSILIKLPLVIFKIFKFIKSFCCFSFIEINVSFYNLFFVVVICV